MLDPSDWKSSILCNLWQGLDKSLCPVFEQIG
jgi:hypothetical protein